MAGPPRWIAAACLAALPLAGCGARSDLDLVVGATAAGAPDRCPSAVAGPKPMAGNCSTRDGRSRVAAPSAPHLTWSTKLPTDSTGQVGPSALATDAAGHAYVVTTGEEDESVAALRRVGTADGSVDWTQPIAPDSETHTPIVLASGGVDLFAYGGQTTDEVFTFDPATGASASTTFGFSLYDAPPDIAVGADGSLYVQHADNVGEADPHTYVSRVAPGGAVLWTSADLGTLGPTPDFPGDVFPSILALGKDDLVVVAVDDLTGKLDVTVVDAFDPATGATRWSTTLPGAYGGGPVVRPDGSIAVMITSTGSNAISILDPATGAAKTSPIPIGVFEIHGATLDGALLMGVDPGQGVTGLAAIDGDGAVLWTGAGTSNATIASDGTVLSFGPTLVALDGATGATKWSLSPPAASACVIDAALTSDGRIVALQCDGTLFGASD
jgi:hypothetical protein